MGVGLPPLEFTECVYDSPYFRENLHKHEKELENTSQQIKRLIKEVKDLITAAKQLSIAQRTFSKSLQGFSFECIGDSQTDDELIISSSLREFGRLIAAIEEERDRMLKTAYDQVVVPLESFRKKHIGGVKEGKKKFDKQTAKFCQSQERYLNLSTKKQDNVLQEADASLDMAERHFCQASMEYVFLLQEVQERKKFEFVETLLSFMFGWLTFYHQGHEVSEDHKKYMQDLQLRIQKTRENFDETRNQTQSLKTKMLEVRQQAHEEPGRLSKGCKREGYLFLQEKKAFGTTWIKYYCTYDKNNKEFTMLPYNQLTSKMVPSAEKMVLSTCVRRMSESIEKRFCFDIQMEGKQTTYTFQALSEDDRKAWMDIMDGREPTYINSGKVQKCEERVLDETGINFVNRCIEVLDNRGLEEQGLYRIVGVASKVNKLLTMGLDRRKSDRLPNMDDPLEWETKTITSALKSYLRNLPEPLMTYRYHNGFIAAAKQETRHLRINDVHTLIHRLPQQNFEILEILINHLTKVAAKSDKNLMTVGNLSVCFGPTLLRPEEETVASIMDLKFYNVVVEILIENYETIFKSKPEKVCDIPI
ncbi:GTPase regulator associated with FAK [Carabus blaptoides fortunei]